MNLRSILAKVERLAREGATEGERDAARRASERLRDRVPPAPEPTAGSFFTHELMPDGSLRLLDEPIPRPRPRWLA